MKKNYFIVLLICFLSCKESKQDIVLSDEIIVINKALDCYGGIEKTQLKTEEQTLLKQYLISIKGPIDDKRLNKKVNYGFFELNNKNNKTELIILFTASSGNLVIYKKKYYRDSRIIDLIKTTLNISNRAKFKKDCG